MQQDHTAKYIAYIFVLTLLIAVPIRIPGAVWLIGQGASADQSFNVDDYRFIASAKHFADNNEEARAIVDPALKVMIGARASTSASITAVVLLAHEVAPPVGIVPPG